MLFLLSVPVSASLNKIATGATVFIGERDVDISSALNGCHTIAWWKNGSDINTNNPDKSSQIYPINTASPIIYHYNITPDFFNGYTGTWYCADKKPYYAAFIVEDPWMTIRVWNLDSDSDVTGKTVPFRTNVTYRIDTNLYKALLTKYRPSRTPDDSPFKVALTDPLGNNVPNIYTGSIGKPGTVIMAFDTKPYVSSSPYIWANGADWDRTARNLQGDRVYPAGQYTVTLSQNLNSMQDTYSPMSSDPTVTNAVVIFEKEPFVVTTTAPVTQGSVAATPVQTLPPATADIPAVATSEPLPKKTTYQPLPAWIGIAGVLAAIVLVSRR